jgi:hypothetical protein
VERNIPSPFPLPDADKKLNFTAIMFNIISEKNIIRNQEI